MYYVVWADGVGVYADVIEYACSCVVMIIGTKGSIWLLITHRRLTVNSTPHWPASVINYQLTITLILRLRDTAKVCTFGYRYSY